MSNFDIKFYENVPTVFNMCSVYLKRMPILNILSRSKIKINDCP